MVGFTPQSNLSIRTNKPFALQTGRLESVQVNDILHLLEETIMQFDPISLVEMDKVKLMNRIDTKFLISEEVLPVILRKAVEHYRIVEIDGLRASPYSSIYFDTKDAEMYTMHHNGKLNRYKIRMRSYVNSGDAFLEIKKKSNKGRTSKKRVKIAGEQFQSILLESEEHNFIQERSPYRIEMLQPHLQNFFHRVTLVDKKETERVTLDMGLKFRRIDVDNYMQVKRLVIVEMKQDGACNSYFRKYLDELSILPQSMSKYCLGMILTNPELKNNRFKKKIRLINKITDNNISIKIEE